MLTPTRVWMAVVVAVISTGCVPGQGEDQSKPTEPSGATTTLSPGRATTEPVIPPGKPPTWNDLIGGWRPVLRDGRRVRVIRVDGWPLTIHFRELATGRWWDGYDGCNWTSGRLRLESTGAFSTRRPLTTLRLCGPVRHPVQLNTTGAVIAGRRMLLDQGRLMILDDEDHVLASYVRSSAHR